MVEFVQIHDQVFNLVLVQNDIKHLPRPFVQMS
jgi:hypothetical protein